MTNVCVQSRNTSIIKIWDYFTHRPNFLVFLCVYSSFPVPDFGNHSSVFFHFNCAFSRISFKWEHTVCRFLSLDYFTKYNAFKIHPCGIRSDQISRSVVSDSLRPHESQHARPPCPSPTPGVHSNSRPLSQ